jgi:DNA-binding CsgD family transcriptional regulator/tetratricopeptide (TPR) repeat protein
VGHARRTVLERDEALESLHRALARTRSGVGEVAVVCGEAGIGKSTVVDEFVRRAAGRPSVHVGRCDPLSTPRPLGPLVDLIASDDADLAARLSADADRSRAFALGWGLLSGASDDRDGRTRILVVEDVHWADEATLDLITHLGRRISGAAALLLLTYRDDEVDPTHPLRARLAALGTTVRTRIALRPLSPSAVAALAGGTGLDGEALHRATGGNPFFVTEVIGTGTHGIPASVRDAVLARAAILAPDARAVLDAAAIVPGRVERWLLAAIGGDAAAGLDACVERGLLRADDHDAFAFRHELARSVIADSIGPSTSRRLHRRALAALREPPFGRPDDARLAHHAAGAGDAEAVVEHARRAAIEAERVGSQTEAERQLTLAIRFADRIGPVERAELLERRGLARVRLGRHDGAVDDLHDAHDLFERVGDVEGAARALARTGRPHTAMGRQASSIAAIDRASALLDGRPVSASAALVATNRAADLMLARQFEACEVEARHAIALAEQAGAADVLSEALIQTGIALAMNGDDDGLVRIRRGIDVARRSGDDQMVALGHSQIGSGYGELRRYDVAMPALREGIAFVEERELLGQGSYMRAWLARCELEIGRWDEAGSLAGSLLRNPFTDGISRFVALVTTAWLRMRRGDPEVAPLLDEATAIATGTRHIQRMWPLAACRAEAAWLDGRAHDETALVAEALALARDVGWAPAIEELVHWARLADGGTIGHVERSETPFGLSAAGRPDLAATRWSAMGCPYDEAMARFLTGDERELVSAHAAFDRLGAEPMRARTAAALRDAGRQAPRRPSALSRANPFDLTDRELEVLGWLASGRTNAQIAGELAISARTVGHHVAHILAKLDVATRSEAAVIADRHGLAGAPRVT